MNMVVIEAYVEKMVFEQRLRDRQFSSQAMLLSWGEELERQRRQAQYIKGKPAGSGPWPPREDLCPCELTQFLRQSKASKTIPKKEALYFHS